MNGSGGSISNGIHELNMRCTKSDMNVNKETSSIKNSIEELVKNLKETDTKFQTSITDQKDHFQHILDVQGRKI